MSITEVERLHAQLAQYEDAFPGYRMEIVGATIMVSPVRPHHNKTIWAVWSALQTQLSADGGLVSDVTFVFDDENEFCPDLAVIPAAEADANRSAYDPDLIEPVVEVVSPGSRRRDYEIKPARYAARGIANYLVLDPYQGHCVTFWHPGPDGYRGRDTIPYGTEVKVDSPLGALMLDTSALPKDPSAS